MILGSETAARWRPWTLSGIPPLQQPQT